jgi:hypothetical protein
MSMPFDNELFQRIIDDKYTLEDVKDLARKYSNAYCYAERVDMERALIEVRMNELKFEINDQAKKLLELYKDTLPLEEILKEAK